MKESWKRVLTILLTLAMLFTNCSPVLGAEESGQTAETEIPCNYIFMQDDGEYQSIILEIGDEEEDILDGAALTYRDGNGDFIEVQAEEVQENLAAFLIPVAQEDQQRVFVSAQAVVQGTVHTVKMDNKEEMEHVEVSEEQATSVVEEVQGESVDTENASEEALDSETARQVQECVITSEEGVTAEEIETAIEETNNLPVTESRENETLAEKPKEKEDYIVVLDPGHGGSDGGAENAYGEDSESILTLKIGTYLKAELEKYAELSVFMTREDDTYVGLSDRVQYAVDKKADILVSLHLNSYESSSANGVEILVPRTGRYNTEVAENAEHLANNILERITSLGLYNRGLKYRDSASGGTYPDGSTSDYYTIIEKGMRAGIPSIIVEHAFISGEQDAQYLDSEEDLMNFAKADAYGIAQYFGIETGGEEYEEVPKPAGEWKKINGKWYYYIGNEKQTGWIEVESKWYYLDADGVMQTGWQKVGGSWYYLNGAGVMQTGWQKIDGEWYYLEDSGEWNPDMKRTETEENDQTENSYTIMGETSSTEEQMIKNFQRSGYEYPAEELEKGGAGDLAVFCKIIKEEAEAEGVRAEVLFVQVMKETGWLQFGGDVKITQFNFGGLGATGNGEPGETFPDVRTGIRAQVQHLKAYASEEDLVNECVDTRFTYVTRNCAPYVEWLGSQENPNHVGWAASERYGYELVEMIHTLENM